MSISASQVTRFGIAGQVWRPAGSFAGKTPSIDLTGEFSSVSSSLLTLNGTLVINYAGTFSSTSTTTITFNGTISSPATIGTVGSNRSIGFESNNRGTGFSVNKRSLSMKSKNRTIN